MKCGIYGLSFIVKRVEINRSHKVGRNKFCNKKYLHGQKYIERIKKNWKIKNISGYSGYEKKCLFQCLKHGEFHLSTPHHALEGHGFKCCQNDKKGRIIKARNQYDEKVKAICRVVRVGEYINTKKIKYKCLMHNEIHLASPNKILFGRGLSCCKREALSFSERCSEKGSKSKIRQ